MIGYLGSLQKRAEADYDIQIIKAQAERDAKVEREAQEKYLQQEKMHDAIAKHRYETVRKSWFFFSSIIDYQF